MSGAIELPLLPEWAAPLEILHCDPPQKVTQQHISLEEVGLSLSLNCRLDFPKSVQAAP